MTNQRLPAVLLQAGAVMALTSLACLGASVAQACTRILYTGANQTVITGRSMDWHKDNSPSIWAMPRGIARDGATGPSTVRWTSKYGSLVVSMYDIATVDGINEKGLVANTLYLAESNYGKPQGKPTLSIAAWAQYVLDNYATVSEAVSALGKEPFRIVAPLLPDGEPAQGHLSISDPSGDSAIVEYVNGKLVIHHGKQYTVMTNSPTYDQQLALNSYWQEIGGSVFMPGTARAADRFARASYLVNAIPKNQGRQSDHGGTGPIVRLSGDGVGLGGHALCERALGSQRSQVSKHRLDAVAHHLRPEGTDLDL